MHSQEVCITQTVSVFFSLFWVPFIPSLTPSCSCYSHHMASILAGTISGPLHTLFPLHSAWVCYYTNTQRGSLLQVLLK